ncbi:MAG: permease prefix domain 1-containing protein [Blastocatellia bacterium]
MKFPWNRKQHDEDLDAEIRSHLDEAIRDRIARGESPGQARADALRHIMKLRMASRQAAVRTRCCSESQGSFQLLMAAVVDCSPAGAGVLGQRE